MNLDLRYIYHGQEACSPNHQCGPDINEQYKIYYIHHGQGSLHSSGTSYALGPGHGFLIYPHQEATYIADEFNPWTYSWIVFEGKDAEDLLTRAHLSKEHPIFYAPVISWFNTFAAQLDQTLAKENSMELASCSILYRFFSELLELSSAVSTFKPKERYVQKAIEYIHSNYQRKIFIAEIANIVGINRMYLTSLFKEILNTSPQHYLHQFRMDKAVELMHNRSLSISEIAHSIGYKDPPFFSKMFKKH
ncbi:AraC family transcriptional regulator [Paenibacillus wynnii]|uniref:AraC family transcriptional regulator n=1 Tax=Paenibacillus wynnii TaxID=268407 RepID=UPI00279366E2|nr:AraC family transcriptional regulator [Paenibacillus wynnii]MDQ0196883.1 AraC-like DNA-binding protein [Paenibacillus wynnii]